MSFLEIIKKLRANENISNVGFFWNIIIDKSSYNNKNLMNDFIIKSQSLFEYFKEKNSIIITTQIFDVDITDKSLFTTYRFINMYKYLQISKKPIIQSDIDFDNLVNLNQFIDKIKGYDIGLFRVKSTPWRKICATLSYFSDERETSKFTHVFGVFLNYFYNSTSDNWFIDQLCLSLTENYLNCTLNSETNICSIYKYSKNVFNYSTLYKNRMLDEYKQKAISHHNECVNIYIYWDTGFDNCPKVVKQVIKSWISKNPNHNVHLLDDIKLFSDGVIHIKDIYEHFPNYDNLKKDLSKQSLADIIRLFLLYKYNGIWVDATCFCNLPLTYWINNINAHDFFAFRYPGTCIPPSGVGEPRLIDNWFLYSNKSYIINKWFHETVKRWNNVNNKLDRILYFENGSAFYFWAHILFNELHNTDALFKNDFNKISNITVSDPQFLEHKHHQHKHILDKITTEAKMHIDNYSSPVYKLTWKFEKNVITALNTPFEKSVLCYLFNANNIIIDNYE
jgi:mannosyltransferase OCH1-like enzyme